MSLRTALCRLACFVALRSPPPCRPPRRLPEAAALAAANKRIANILKKSDETIPASVDPAGLVETAEKALASAVTAMTSTVTPLFAKREYEAALKQLASLRPTVDTFFDAVMVNTEEKQLRLNRLALLRQLECLVPGSGRPLAAPGIIKVNLTGIYDGPLRLLRRHARRRTGVS